jgi:hypothetical protein
MKSKTNPRARVARKPTADARRSIALRTELVAVMAAISKAQSNADELELAATVATTASLMSKSWTIRYQLAAIEYDGARAANKRAEASRLMVRASKEADNWAKRLIVARKSIDDDDILGAEVHDQEQAELGTQLKLLAG